MGNFRANDSFQGCSSVKIEPGGNINFRIPVAFAVNQFPVLKPENDTGAKYFNCIGFLRRRNDYPVYPT